MNGCNVHSHEDHQHAAGCGHIQIMHEGHIDFLHDGHLHHPHNGHFDEHTLAISPVNPDACTEGHACSSHPSDHVHGSDCGHPSVPHGDHVCYLVDGHLHFPHNGHCDHHGAITLA